MDPNSSITHLPGLPFTEQWQRCLAFDVATSLGWDTGRAVTNFVCVMPHGSHRPHDVPPGRAQGAVPGAGASCEREAGWWRADRTVLRVMIPVQYDRPALPFDP